MKIFYAMMAVALCAGMTACSDDDDNEKDTPAGVSSLVAGSYSGTMSVSAAGVDAGTVSTSVAMVAAGDDTVVLTLGGFTLNVSLMGMTVELGNVVVPAVTVKDNGNGSYAIVADSFTAEGVAFGASAIDITGSLAGTLSANGTLAIDFSLTPGSMPFALEAQFTTAAE